MSAVPNVPEPVLERRDAGPDAALKHSLKSKLATVEHIERVESEPGMHSDDVNGSSKPAWLLHDAPVENQRPMRVIVIGAGYSGIYLGIRIPERIRNCELVIYEKNDGFGGTW